MATHSSILAWKIPSTEEPGGLQSMGSQKESDTERLNNSNNKVPFNCKDFSYPVLFFFSENYQNNQMCGYYLANT